MRKIILPVLPVLIVWAACQPPLTPRLAKSLNQPLPGRVPGVFAPGIISGTHQEHSAPAIAPDGSEIYWSRWNLPRAPGRPPQSIRVLRYEDGAWLPEARVSFSGQYMDGGPCLMPDGRSLIFYSNRPIPGTEEETPDINLWRVTRKGKAWGEPEPLNLEVQPGWTEASPSVAANGNLYFSAGGRTNGVAGFSKDLYRAQYQHGRYGEPENLGAPVNSSRAREGTPCIAPDESWLIYTIDDRVFDENRQCVKGSRRLMISFADEAGRWQPPIDMGPLFNAKGARFPGLSPDGRVLFFTRYVDGPDEDIFWVDASIVDTYQSIAVSQSKRE